MYLGTGSDTRIDFSGTVVTPNPPAGKGWVQVLLERTALNDFFVANPEAEGRPAPTNEQVLTYNAALGVAEWQDAGTGFSYQTDNAAVSAAPGATTSQKISSAIGSPSYIGRNATCIVQGAPGTTYEGLYIYSGTEWLFGAHFAFNTSDQVPATNPMTLTAASTQAVLSALKLVDDGLQSQITSNDGDIATLQGEMAQAQTDINDLEINKLNKASNTPIAGQILSFDGTGQLWVDDAQGDVTGVTGTSPITVDNTDPQTPVVGINAASTSAPGAVQLSTALDSTSITQATTPFAIKAVNDVAVAAIPRASYTAEGDILVGTGAGTFGPLGVGSDGQVLTVVSGTPAWTDDAPGDVTSVTGTAPITVDNTDPQTPIVGVNLATTAAPGVVQVELTGNLTLVAGVINVPDASTTVKGAVSLNNTLSSSSTTQALTAAQGAVLQGQIDALTIAANTTLAGGWDALNGVVDGVTAAGLAAGFVNGDPLPPADPSNEDYYLVCVVSGPNPSAMENGDWLLSDGTNWLVLGVGARPPQATYDQQGIVQLADAAAVLAGTSDTTAITPQALQDNVIDAVNVTNSSQIASATAVKTAYDAGVQGQTDAAAALAVANASLPKAGGTMTGTITAQNVNVQGTYSLQFAGGVNGSLNAVTDATNVTSSTTAASATAVKAAYDAGIQGQTDAAAAQTDADQALIDAAAAQSTADQAIIDAAAAQSTADAAIPDATFTTAGELLYGTGAGTYDVLPIGTNGQSLIVSAGEIAWGASLSGYTNTATPFNTALGGNAGDSITSGTGNTSIGYNAGTAVTTGVSNTLVGANAGDSITNGGANTALGFNALAGVTSGGTNVAVGAGSLQSTTSGSNLVAVGFQALAANSSGLRNTAVGTSAGQAVTTSSDNTYIGFAAGDTATGSNNTLVGSNAGSALTLGGTNILIGANAGDVITTGFNNTIIGDVNGSAALTDTVILAAGSTVKFQANTSGAWSPDGTNFGTAGQVLTSGGSGAVPTWTTPQIGDITAVTAGTGLTGGGTSGDVTLSLDSSAVIAPSLLTATGDIIYASAASTAAALPIGSAGQVLTVAAGVPTWAAPAAPLSGYTCTATPFNTALGGNAGNSITSGVNNTALGYNAGTAITAGNNNTYVGFGSGDAATSGDNNTGLGSNALGAGGTNNNTGLGANTGAALTTGGGNTFVGANAGDAATTADNTVAVGLNALGGVATAPGSVAIGANTLAVATSGGCNVAVGFNAGTAVTNGSVNTFVGGLAGDSVTSGANNVAIGFNALTTATTSGNNVAVGNNALTASTAANLVAVGHNALQANTTGTANTALGYTALSLNITGSQSTAVGFGAGQNVSGNANTLIGYNAGNNITTGTTNTIVGSYAGTTTLSNNLVLAAGSTIKLQVNENGAVGVGSTPSYGTSGQVLTSAGTGGAPTWSTPQTLSTATTKATVAATPLDLLSFSGAIRMGTLTVMLTDNSTNVAWANITIASDSGVGSSIITSSTGTFGFFTLETNAGNDTLVTFTPSVSLATVNAVYKYTASFGSQPTVL
jgi:hypothetical protein